MNSGSRMNSLLQRQVSLVMPVYNEAEGISRVLRGIQERVLSPLPGSELIVLEDGSTDGTKERLRELQAELGFVLDMKEERRGYLGAMRDGFRQAQCDMIGFMDSDGQHDPADFLNLLEVLREADLVIGVKHPRRDSVMRRLMGWGLNAVVIPALFGRNYRDIDCGFRLMRRPVVEYWLAREWSFRNCVASELTLRAAAAGFRVATCPVAHFPREFGESRGIPPSKVLATAWEVGRNLRRLRRELRGRRNSEF